jgi:beta-glucosidase-like glycosyl hydrolase
MKIEWLEKISSHLLVGIEGYTLTEDEIGLLSLYPPAGVILFHRNVRGRRQLRELTGEIVDVITDHSGRIPIIAADHEGGVISVLAGAIGVPPAAFALGRIRRKKTRTGVYVDTAALLRSCGVNMLLAPVADVSFEPLNPVIGERAFAEDVNSVASRVVEFVESMRECGMCTCLKHFPGHGSSREDSHETLPTLELSVSEMITRDIVPFIHGMEAGASSVMVGHLKPRGRELPCSIDSYIVDQLLRGELGFEGVVITDALEMEGIQVLGDRRSNSVKQCELMELTSLVLGAGNDVALFSRPYGEVAGIINECKSVDIKWQADSYHNSKRRLYALRDSLATLNRMVGKGKGKGRKSFQMSKDLIFGTALDSINTYPRSYRLVAQRSVRRVSDGRISLPVPSLRNVRFDFMGEMSDFENVPVRRFIARILADREYVFKEMGNIDFWIKNGSRFLASLRKMASYRLPKYEYRSDLFRFRVEEVDLPEVKITFLLNRKPLSESVTARVTDEADVIVVAGWHYASEYIRRDKCVLVSYGVYDAAADEVRCLLGMSQGRKPEQK